MGQTKFLEVVMVGFSHIETSGDYLMVARDLFSASGDNIEFWGRWLQSLTSIQLL